MLIYHGIALMIVTGLGLYGVLYQLHHLIIASYHQTLWKDPFTPQAGWTERRHMRKRCSECSMIADMATTRLVQL